MREITQGMLDRYRSRAVSLGYWIYFDSFVGRREQRAAMIRVMTRVKYRRKWDPHLKMRYSDDPRTGKRTYFRSYHPRGT